MLGTNLKHLETKEEAETLVTVTENVMICCGRMGPMCLPVYAAMEELEKEYPHVELTDMDFDIPAASFIKNLPECASFMSLPFTVYFKDGKVADVTSGIQSKGQVSKIIDNAFGKSS